jgi:hypothetical protein
MSYSNLLILFRRYVVCQLAVVFGIGSLMAQLNVTISGSITNSDPLQTGSVSRNGIASQAGIQKSYPGGDVSIPTHFDSYTFQNNSGSTLPYYIDLTSSFYPTESFSVAYLGSFNPTNIALNYLGDAGSSPSPSSPHRLYSVSVPDGQAFVVVVNEVASGNGVPSYTLNVSTSPPGTSVPEGGSTLALAIFGLGGMAVARHFWRAKRGHSL